ncbi:MAG: sensor histidine kinase [Thermoanaerobaculia bacterium]
MESSIRRGLWTAFGALFIFVTVAATMNLIVLQKERQQNLHGATVAEPLLGGIMAMDGSVSAMLAASRGYTLTRRTEFLAQYDEALRSFDTKAAAALAVASESADRRLIDEMRVHYQELKELSDRQIHLTDEGQDSLATETMLDAARRRRSAADFTSTFQQREMRRHAESVQKTNTLRTALTVLLVGVSIAILFIGAFAVVRIENSIESSIGRQVKRTEAMIGGMADGVMLVDGDGRVVFVNPAAEELLGSNAVDIPMENQAATYGLTNLDGTLMDAREIPAARALSTGKPAKDVTVDVRHPNGQRVTVSMNAVPIHEDGVVSGVIVSIRDVTARRRLETEMQLQAERAQIIADAGAFFASNIDPVWVTQAIVERVAEVLGDWAAVIIREPGTDELRVASIYHRDMASIGLAWSFVYRQPLVVGEGIFGQVVSSGLPSLTSNVTSTVNVANESTAYHTVPMKLFSLLVLPLRTRREVLGALVIAANDPDRQMNDQKLPLAELIAERAAVAIENARLYTEQVEARRKLEGLSRIKDEFLSIASHELRTPVTSIKGYTQLARTLINEGDLGTSDEYLGIALDQIERMSRLIFELLDVSRIETGRLEIRREDIEWEDFVRSVVRRHSTAISERTFHLDASIDGLVVEGDRDRLEQVLGNLLENAVKYSPDGSDIRINVRAEDEKVVTSVSDRGIGIPEDEINLVFERFHRGRQVSAANYGGLGLGLYISREIIDRHGGSIWVESREGAGTTFSVSLPARPAERNAVEGQVEEPRQFEERASPFGREARGQIRA